LAGKRLEPLEEVLPGIARGAVLSDPVTHGTATTGASYRSRPEAYGWGSRACRCGDQATSDTAFAVMSRERPDALMTVPDGLTVQHCGQIAEFALRARLPTMRGCRGFTDAAELMSYGPSLRDGYQRLATFEDKIPGRDRLRGSADRAAPDPRRAAGRVQRPIPNIGMISYWQKYPHVVGWREEPEPEWSLVVVGGEHQLEQLPRRNEVRRRIPPHVLKGTVYSTG
jgi:hypothetical protein